MLKPQAGTTLLRGRGLTARAASAGGVLHGMALVEDDHAVEVSAEPVDDLLDPRDTLPSRVGAQRGVGREQDALLEPDRRALAEA